MAADPVSESTPTQVTLVRHRSRGAHWQMGLPAKGDYETAQFVPLSELQVAREENERLRQIMRLNGRGESVQRGPYVSRDEEAALAALPRADQMACLLCGGLEPGEASGSVDVCVHERPVSIAALLSQLGGLERQTLAEMDRREAAEARGRSALNASGIGQGAGDRS